MKNPTEEENRPASQRVKLSKGQIVTARIASLAAGGDGVTKDLGMPIFVSRVAPGDLAEIELFDVRKDFARGKVVKLIEPSSQRAEPPCKLFKVCGGCQWQHLSYDYQLENKTDIVRQAIKHIAHLDASLVRPALAAADPLNYRNKVQFPVTMVPSTGRLLAGYYKENSHELVNIKHCPVQPEALDRMLVAVKDACTNNRVTGYEEETHQGLLRHICARYSFDRAQVLITLVINTTSPLNEGLLKKFNDVAEELSQVLPEMVGFGLNFNDQQGNRIMGEEMLSLKGEPYLVERLQSNLPQAPPMLKTGLSFRLSPMSFFQVNSQQAVVLLDEMFKALAGDDLSGRLPLVIDAYAGVGTMALWLSGCADKVIAIEEVDQAVEDGKINLEINQVTNVEFRTGRVEEIIPQLIAQAVKADAVVVDPPRKGLDAQALTAIIKLDPSLIVYISCNPATLARDLKILVQSGYQVKYIQPVDMFPQTYHIESVTLLSKA